MMVRQKFKSKNLADLRELDGLKNLILALSHYPGPVNWTETYSKVVELDTTTDGKYTHWVCVVESY